MINISHCHLLSDCWIIHFLFSLQVLFKDATAAEVQDWLAAFKEFMGSQYKAINLSIFQGMKVSMFSAVDFEYLQTLLAAHNASVDPAGLTSFATTLHAAIQRAFAGGKFKLICEFLLCDENIQCFVAYFFHFDQFF